MPSARFGRNLSIRTKIIATVAGTLLVAQCITAYLIRSLVNEHIVSQKIALADILTTSILHDIKYTMRNDALEGGPSIIAKYMTYYRDISAMTIYDASRSVVATSAATGTAGRAADPEVSAATTHARPSLKALRSASGGLEIRSVAPILRGSRIVGAIDLDLSVRDVRATLAAIDQRIALIMTIKLLLVGVVLFILLRRSILQRLRRLIEVTASIASGHYEIHVDDDRKDEIGALGAAFNRMTADLKASKFKIESYNRELERRVQEATAEAVKAFDDLKSAQSQLVLNEKMASLGVLIAGIAHEINTPVGAILNVSRSLERCLRGLPKELSWLRGEFSVPFETFQACLEELVRAASQPHQASLFRDLRAVENLLRERGIEDYRATAATLTRFNFTSPELVARYAECFRLTSFLAFAEPVASIAQAAKISETSSQKIGEIVRALKYYAYSDKDRVENIQVNESIQTALVLLRNQLKHAATVTTDYDAALPKIGCSSDIHQIWTNLLTNAIDATAQVGDGRGGQIKIATRRTAESIVVTIRDNGSGIPPAVVPKIFDPFFTTKDIGKGTGLGLAVVAGIVKKHGGTISVESRPGRTEFTVRLPITLERAEAA